MRGLFKRFSLQLKILLFTLLISIVSLGLFSAFASHLLANSVQSNAVESAHSELEILNLAFGDLVFRVEEYVRLLAANTQLQQCIAEYLDSSDDLEQQIKKNVLSSSIGSVVSSVVSPRSSFLGCLILYDGKVIYSGMGMEECGAMEKLPADYLGEILSSQKAVWMKAPIQLDSAVLRKPINVIAVSKKIIERSLGRELGSITLFLDEREIAGLYDSAPDGAYFLLDDALQIISASDDQMLYLPFSQFYPLTSEQFRLLRQDGALLCQTASGDLLLTAQQNESTGWWLVKYTDLRVIQKDQSHIRRTLLIFLLATSSAAFVLLWIVSVSLGKPIRTLTGVMRQIDGRHSDLRAPEDLPGEVGVLAAGFNQLMDKLQQNILQIQQAEQQQRENELRLLQEQIQPHFLYNTLQMIGVLVKSGEEELAQSGLYALADFYKYCLNQGGNIISVGDELAIIQQYLCIQRMRYIDRIDFMIDAEPQTLACAIPKLTLQPLVENAIYHGLKPKAGKGMLFIHVFEDHSMVVLEIMDTGVGMPEAVIQGINADAPPEGRSYGIRNVFQRLRLLYGSAVHIFAKSVPGEYTSVRITIQTPRPIEEAN